jgi:Amt family ammonium transporter
VAITAGCAAVEAWVSIIIGIMAGAVYICSSKLLLHFKIDDPLSAVAVHGACGIWGVLAVGLFSTETGLFFTGSGEQLGVLAVGVLSIVAWTAAVAFVSFLIIDRLVGVRVSVSHELVGMDAKFGGSAYPELFRIGACGCYWSGLCYPSLFLLFISQAQWCRKTHSMT